MCVLAYMYVRPVESQVAFASQASHLYLLQIGDYSIALSVAHKLLCNSYTSIGVKSVWVTGESFKKFRTQKEINLLISKKKPV